MKMWNRQESVYRLCISIAKCEKSKNWNATRIINGRQAIIYLFCDISSLICGLRKI